MKTRLFLTTIVILCCNLVMAQQQNLDSLITVYKKNKQDSTLVLLLLNKGIHYRGVKPDSVIICLNQSLALARKIDYKAGERISLDLMGLYYFDSGDLAESMKIAFELLPKAQAFNDQVNVWGVYTILGLDYYVLQDYKKAFSFLQMSKNVAEKHRLYYYACVSYYNLAYSYVKWGRLDSAEYYSRQLFEHRSYVDNSNLLTCTSLVNLLKGDYAAAISAAKESIQEAPGKKNYNVLSSNYLVLAKAYQKLSRPDSSLFFAKISYEHAGNGKRPTEIIESAGFLRDYYQSVKDYKQAFDYQRIVLKANDSLYNQRKALQVQSVTSEEEQRGRAIAASREAYQNKVRLYSALGAFGVAVAIAAILLYYNRQRRKANLLLHEQKKEMAAQRDNLEQAYNQLQTTQTQLVQREKMASLGELTAGIAHEIQNPLNFVNNFSEVNKELLEELKAESKKPKADRDEQLEMDLMGDVIENEKKINLHGKRADAIVKGMLQHSQTGKGAKEPTDINALAEERLRLAYHAMQSKNPDFHAETSSYFDPGLPQINLIPQDIGRVLLNLFNNAFYAVNQKLKTSAVDYKPEVSVTTAFENGNAIIRVKDNGNGIPDAIKDKIMQPFFTTKPTGEGTGLGLSLSYDIVVKGHGGKIDINSTPGEGATFTITLPIEK